MILPITYGRPHAATMKRRKGFLDGLGRTGVPSGIVPVKAANLEGVSSLGDEGGGLPVTFAISVRIQRINVNIPRTEPRVVLRLPNCSATETIAIHSQLDESLYVYFRCVWYQPKNDDCVAI